LHTSRGRLDHSGLGVCPLLTPLPQNPETEKHLSGSDRFFSPLLNIDFATLARSDMVTALLGEQHMVIFTARWERKSMTYRTLMKKVTCMCPAAPY